MRFTRYPKGEPYQITPRKLAGARRAVQRQKDRYPLFPELLKRGLRGSLDRIEDLSSGPGTG